MKYLQNVQKLTDQSLSTSCCSEEKVHIIYKQKLITVYLYII